MLEESTRLQDIRLDRLKDLQTRHYSELGEFDQLSRRYTDHSSPRSSRNFSSNSYSPRMSRNFNQGSPRHSGRSLGTPTTRFPQPSRESSTSMTSLQSSANSRSSGGSGGGQYNTPLYPARSSTNVTGGRTRNSDSRNGNVGDRRSYHDPSSGRR